jgi:hypothetical protein
MTNRLFLGRSGLIAIAFTALFSIATACDAPTPPESDPVDLPEGPCGHALVVVSTDYASTSVAIVGFDGTVHAPAILTSGSEAPGLSVALSGDVVTASERATDGRAIVIDRYPASAITWLDPRTPEAPTQLDVQTGFASNPQDVIDLGDGRAIVARYEANLDAGREPFDAGSDLLVVDTREPAIVGRVDLSPAMTGAAPGILPRPARLRRVGDRVAVLLAAYSADFSDSADARVALVDPAQGTVDGFVVLDGLRGCSALDVAPSGARLLVACSGTFGGTSTPSIDDAGLAVVDLDEAGALVVSARIGADALTGDPLGFAAAFTSEATVLATTFGRLDGGAKPDRLLAVDLTTGAFEVLLTSESEPFTLGDVRCAVACGACFVADADRDVVHRIAVENGQIGARSSIAIDDGLDLPARYLGAY